jgi:hypothetical protein
MFSRCYHNDSEYEHLVELALQDPVKACRNGTEDTTIPVVVVLSSITVDTCGFVPIPAD